MIFHLTRKSENAKTGPIPVSTTSADTCPDACSLRGNGCYAESGPIGIHWRAVSSGERGTDLATFAAAIAELPNGQLWRHNQAGDLPGTGDAIDAAALGAIVRANRHKRGFTYTHKPLTRENRACIRGANKHGFTVNVSCDSLAAADAAKQARVGPVVAVVASDYAGGFTPAGHRVVVCPAQTHEKVACDTCRLCAWSERDVVIGFQAHGARKKTVDRLVRIGEKK
jgi:hypothetical protein